MLNLKKGYVHALFEMSKNEERSKFAYFEGLVHRHEWVGAYTLTTDQEVLRLKSPEDLLTHPEIVFGVSRGNWYGKYLTGIFDKISKKQKKTLSGNNVARSQRAMLQAGRIRLYFSSTYASEMDDIIKAGLDKKIILHPNFMVDNGPIHFGLSKAIGRENYENLVASLKKMRDSGRIKALAKKYMKITGKSKGWFK